MNIQPRSILFGETFRTVLYPLSIYELVGALEKKGYEISPNIPTPSPSTRMSGTGEIGRKGRVAIIIDSSAQSLRVKDITITSAKDNFNDITEILKTDFNVDLHKLARFYSYTAEHELPLEESYKTIAKALKFPLYDEIEKIIDEKIWPFGIRIGGAEMKPNSEEWFDITMRPNYEKDNSLIVNVVFRNPNWARTIDFIETYEDKIQKIANLLSR